MTMKRRAFLKKLSAGVVMTGSLTPWLQVLAADNVFMLPQKQTPALFGPELDKHIKDGLHRSKDFNRSYDDDILLNSQMRGVLQTTVGRLSRLQHYIGYANFSLLGFDDALKFASRYSRVGQFSKQEIDFIESIFFEDASRYGFWGDKVTTNLTANIVTRDTIKMRGTGQYLFQGQSLQMYHKIKKDMGSSIILTSGIRGMVKQIYLFLAKAVSTNGNLSQASRSLAPPGHSYHGVGDFDVGKLGFGVSNFTAAFSATDEYRRLCQLGYVLIRYTQHNPYGVRFEPWHIKVV